MTAFGSGACTRLVKMPFSETFLPSKGPVVPGGGQGEAGVRIRDLPCVTQRLQGMCMANRLGPCARGQLRVGVSFWPDVASVEKVLRGVTMEPYDRDLPVKVELGPI